jgi:hypothetical protein
MNEEKFEINREYADALIENSEFHKKVQKRQANYQSAYYYDLKKKLLKHQLAMTSKEIIQHAEHLFPQVGE